MDALTTLLARAEQAGLQVHADGDRLIVRGPRTGEALAREILDHKAEILSWLAWDGTRADRLLRDELAYLADLCSVAWEATTGEWEAIHATEETINAAYSAQDMAALHRALRVYQRTIFTSFRRHDAAGTQNTNGITPAKGRSGWTCSDCGECDPKEQSRDNAALCLWCWSLWEHRDREAWA